MKFLKGKSFLVLLLILINAVLLVVFFKPSHQTISSSTTTTTNNNWQNVDYPEISSIGKDWDFQKYTKYFQNLAEQKGGEYAYHALATAANKGYIAGNVDTHLLGHTVGDVLYKQKGIEGIKVCTDDIRNACSHSIVVGYLLENGASSLGKAVEACHDAPGGSGAYTMCVHGLGHGVLAYEEYDMKKAVNLCNKIGTLKSANIEIGQCIGGVTMEMMAGVHDHEAWIKQVPNYFKENDPLAPCDSGFISKEYTNFCYVYLTPHLFKSAGVELSFPDPKLFNKAMKYCEGIPFEDRNRSTCFGSFGKEYVVLSNARNVQNVSSMKDAQLLQVYNWCKLGPVEGVSPCIESALQSIYWGGENDSKVSVRFCNIIPDQKYSNECMENLIGSVSYYVKDAKYRELFCSEVTEKFKEDCRARLLNPIR
ncbi:hypothetical protein H0W91_02135 [Patescibacteria group bacterium]|nr:hypothetical protein [Patescibacteria group bacterium]